jgi:mannitol 2-dehydrogenase
MTTPASGTWGGHVPVHLHGVDIPDYDRESLTGGLVHIGVGQFHRSHLAVYLDDLFRQGSDRGWAIRGIGLRAEDAPLRDALIDQDCRYSVTEKHPDGTRVTRLVGSLVEYIDGYTEPDAAIEAIADPQTRIVSLTITEGGYHIDRRTGEFRLDEPGVAADLAGTGLPRSVFGVVCEGLRRRRDRGLGPVTVLSCDNVQGNGVVARRAFSTFAGSLDPDLADWMSEHVSFPNTMVDRITPPTFADDIAELRSRTGLLDRAAVLCEPFRQFVVEDDFAAGRPGWERVGVQMVADVEPFEQMKLRLLNAPHQILAHFGLLAGYTHTAEAMRDADLVSLLTRFQQHEAMPTIPPVPGTDLPGYAATVRERFANPQMDDTLVRIATSASDRIANFVLPLIRDRLATGRSFDIAAATVAAWLHRLHITAAGDFPVEVPDPGFYINTSSSLREMLAHPIFGGLGDEPRFVDACQRSAEILAAQDVSVAIRSIPGI